MQERLINALIVFSAIAVSFSAGRLSPRAGGEVKDGDGVALTENPKRRSPEMGSRPELAPSMANHCDDSELERLKRKIEMLEHEQQIQAANYDWLEREAYGSPVEWPGSTPSRYLPENVEPALERVFNDCELGFTLGTVDCSEAPCLAAIVGSAPGLREKMMSCPAWTEAFGNELQARPVSRVCSDSEGGEYYSFVTSVRLVWSDYWMASSPDEMENKKQRLDYREAEFGRDWHCRQ